jgi:branched-chain amino acid transport system permease protein
LNGAAGMERSRLASTALLLLLVVAMAALPLTPLGADKFTMQLLTRIMIMAILAMSLDLAMGVCGLVSFGHAAFFGLAGYVLALMTPPGESVGFWTSLAAAMAAAGALALLIGVLVLRTTGVYFIMVTLALAQMLYFLFHDTKLAGGSDGIYIYVRPDAALFGFRPFDLENVQHLYYVVLATLLLSYLLLRRMLRSLFGKVLSGIRINELRMKSLGYATFRYKLVCFTLSGTFAGLAGYLAALQFGVVNPDMLGWHLSGSAMMMVILGGMGTLWGSVIGASAMILAEMGFQSLPAVTIHGSEFNLGKHWQLWMGSFIVLVALYLPQGLGGALSGAWKKLFARKVEPGHE